MAESEPRTLLRTRLHVVPFQCYNTASGFREVPNPAT